MIHFECSPTCPTNISFLANQKQKQKNVQIVTIQIAFYLWGETEENKRSTLFNDYVAGVCHSSKKKNISFVNNFRSSSRDVVYFQSILVESSVETE